jgi:hypothetical protein
MKPFDPNTFAHGLPILHRQFVQSVNNVLNSNVDLGTPTGNAPTDSAVSGINAGVYTQFQQGNGTGKLIRIAAAGNITSGADYNWTTAGAGVVINHGLLRQPIGFHVADADGDARLYRTTPPDMNQITLTTTDPTVSNTIYVF